jgi:hypothetical protein
LSFFFVPKVAVFIYFTPPPPPPPSGKQFPPVKAKSPHLANYI